MKSLDELVYDAGFLPILLPGEDDGCAERVVRAIEETAVPVVEILQRGPVAKKVLKDALAIRKRALIGAGTITTLEQCKEAVALGADFIVSPGYKDEIVDWCVSQSVPVIPGCTTVSEMMKAAGAGVTLAKFFPFYEEGGLKRLIAISQPFPALRFVITGFTDDKEFWCLSEKRVAGIGGLWMFQSETDLTVKDGETIVRRINKSLELAAHYRRGWED